MEHKVRSPRNVFQRNSSARMPHRDRTATSYSVIKEMQSDENHPNQPNIKTGLGRKNRTLSVDAGVQQMVQRYYESKLEQAKKETDEELKAFLNDLFILENKTTNKTHKGYIQVLKILRNTAESIRNCEPQDLIGGNCKRVVMGTFQLVSNLQQNKQLKLLTTKLLCILAKCCRTAEYLEDSTEGDFISWAIENFQQKRTDIVTALAEKSGQAEEVKEELKLNEETESGTTSYVVCRICEGVIGKKNLSDHSKLCIKIANYNQKFNEIIDKIKNLYKDNLLKIFKEYLEKYPGSMQAKLYAHAKKIIYQVIHLIPTSSNILNHMKKLSDNLSNVDLLISQQETTHEDTIVNTLGKLNQQLRELYNLSSRIHQDLLAINKQYCTPHGARYSREHQGQDNNDVAEIGDDDVCETDGEEGNEEEDKKMASNFKKPSINDFEIAKPISRGSYGSVVLGKKKKNRRILRNKSS